MSPPKYKLSVAFVPRVMSPLPEILPFKFQFLGLVAPTSRVDGVSWEGRIGYHDKACHTDTSFE